MNWIRDTGYGIQDTGYRMPDIVVFRYDEKVSEKQDPDERSDFGTRYWMDTSLNFSFSLPIVIGITYHLSI